MPTEVQSLARYRAIFHACFRVPVKKNDAKERMPAQKQGLMIFPEAHSLSKTANVREKSQNASPRASQVVSKGSAAAT
jgi:hypothetical protein